MTCVLERRPPVAAGGAASARVRHLLRRPPSPVPVLHQGALAAYLDVDGTAVGLLAAGAARVPSGVRTRLEALPPGAATATAGAGALHLAGLTVRVTRTVDVSARPAPPAQVRVPSAAAAAADRTGDLLDRRALCRLRRRDARAVPALVGAGPGLTPAGDDVLAGWLVATPPELATGVRRAVAAALSRTTPVSATLLDCALHGEAVPELAALLAAWRAADETRAHRAASALAALGASSGAALLCGALLATRAAP